MKPHIVTSLKEMSRVLNISYYKARKIKDQIKRDNGGIDIPEKMFFNGRYNVEQFERYL